MRVEAARSAADQIQSPATTESVVASRASETVNAADTEDAMKYLPSVLVRKRFIGDTQAPLATRTTGINAGARTLIFADGILLSTLINNNNGNGSPQWFMVAPEEIDRIDVMYGPFSAAYPGNSYGAVTVITTRMPKQFEADAKVSVASQSFGQYGTHDRYPATEASATLGDRAGSLSWWVSANHLSSFSQPLTYLTVNQATPVLPGAFAERNRTGGAMQVTGADNITHTVQDTAKVKLAYDFSSALSAAYELGYFQNKAQALAQSYLTATGPSGALFPSNAVDQEHWMQSLSLKTKMHGPWNWEAAISRFNYAKDITRTSTNPFSAAAPAGPGRIADAGGTGWDTIDMRGKWRTAEGAPTHQVSFGVHADQYTLINPTYNTSDWVAGGNGTVFSDSRGKTRTDALWAQDLWRLSSAVSATVGGRYERWHAYDGFNLSTASNGTAFPVTQPSVDHNGFSPKLSLMWQANDLWTITGSLGKALRFPTVGELYQNVQSGSVFLQANPFLKPETVKSGELALERDTASGKLRISLFEEHVSDALISQTSTIAGSAQPVSFVQNIDATRQRGIELVAQQNDALIHGLELNGSVTYVDARITANSGYVPTIAGATSVGKRTPYVPEWRATVVATYRPNEKLAYTLAGRYSSRLFATVDNTDINPATYQGFESFFVMDARVRYQIDMHWSAAFGIDNLNNRQYFLFHPFPQRTVFAELKYDY